MTTRRSRGEGSIYKRGDGLWCAYLIVGWDENGKAKRRYIYKKRKAEVQEELHRLSQDVRQGNYAEQKKVRISQFLKTWLDSHVRQQNRESTHAQYSLMVSKHINPYIGGIQLAQLDQFQIRQYYSTLEKRAVGSRTRLLVHGVLRKAFSDAKKWGQIINNPFELVTRPKHVPKLMRCLNKEEIARFLLVAQSDPYYVLYILAITTGMRQGEIFGLKWQDIDFQNSLLSVRRTAYELNGKMQIGEPKTKTSRRALYLPKFITGLLADYQQEKQDEGESGEWVFTGLDGGILRRSNFRKRHFLPLLEASGVSEICFHELRHTAATLLLSEGINPKVIQERLGHSQINTTLDIYSHVLPSMQKEAADKLESYFSGYGEELKALDLPKESEQKSGDKLQLSCSRRVFSGFEAVNEKEGLANPSETLPILGALGRIRTCDPLIRSQVLYPAELRALRQTDCLKA